MRRLTIAISLAALAAAGAGPAVAQSRQAQQRWDAAQARYAHEVQTYNYERDLYTRAGGRLAPYGQQGYNQGQPGYPGGQQGYYQGQQGQQGYYQGQQGQQGYYQGQQGQGQYRDAPPPPPSQQGGYASDRYENGYDPAQHYRGGSSYQERTLSSDDRVYRGSDGRYYCKRSDGTTGLIIGAAGGGVLGNVIDGGHSRAVGTLVGGALGALLGKTIQQQSSSVKCQ